MTIHTSVKDMLSVIGFLTEAIQNADEAFNLEEEATILTTEGILLNKEIDAANLLLNVANYDPDLVVNTGGTNSAP